MFAVICICGSIMAYFRWLKPELAKLDPEPVALDYARSFFPVLLLVFLLRGFIAEPFRIPSGSMLSNLEVGDFILVNKFTYGIRLPILQTKVLEMNSPDRGDIVVFRYPLDPSQNYIKRLIGVPGDRIAYDYSSKSLFVNGERVQKIEDGTYLPFGSQSHIQKFKQRINRVDGTTVEFPILNAPAPPSAFRSLFSKRLEWVVPEGHYFVMGDNRDNSLDSRSQKNSRSKGLRGGFTFVPDENIVGKAFFVWLHMSFGGDGFKPSRIGTDITAQEVAQ